MSRLEFYSRPLVAFDPTNKEHRAIFYKFSVTHGWAHSPYRFIVPDDHGDLITLMQRGLIDYYVKKEFGALKLVSQKREKTVDKAPKK